MIGETKILERIRLVRREDIHRITPADLYAPHDMKVLAEAHFNGDMGAMRDQIRTWINLVINEK
jgi:hypothetical protein